MPSPEIGITRFTAHPDGYEANFILVVDLGCYASAPDAFVRDNHDVELGSVYICPMFSNGTPDFGNLGELVDWSEATIAAIKKALFNVTL